MAGGHTIRIDFDIARTAAEACSWMTDESAELALLTAWTCDLRSQMIIAEAMMKWRIAIGWQIHLNPLIFWMS